ncbi:MAG: GAF domain-containing protein [Cyanobacteria bacterium P01_F01_bin.150]
MSVSKVASTHYEKQLVALGRALQKVREADQVGVMVETVVQYLRTGFDYTLVWLGLYHADNHVVVGQGGFTDIGDKEILTQKIALEPGELLEQVVIQKRLIGVPDLQDEPKGGKWQKFSRQLNIKGSLMFPIRHRDECLGVAILGQSVWGIPVESDEKARLSMILGELGTALHQFELMHRYQQSAQPVTAISSLLAAIHPLENVEERLAVLVREVHQFLRSDRTHLYWFSPEQRLFWRWIGQPGDKRQAEPQIKEVGRGHTSSMAVGMVEIRRNQVILPPISSDAIESFQHQLAATQVVAVSDVGSMLHTNTIDLIMDQMGGQSMLAVPITVETEMLGFLAVTGQQPRLWSDEEKQYLKSVGQLTGLVAPLLEPEQTIETIRQDQSLASEICQAVCSQEEWNSILDKCHQDIQDRFEAERLIILSYNEGRETFSILYQSLVSGRQRQLKGPLPSLSDTDWALLERSQVAIVVEDVNHDLKLMDWHPFFTEVGLKSFLVCPVTIGCPANGLVIIGHTEPHHWTKQDKRTSQVISQQIGTLLRQWHLNYELEQRQSIHQAIHGSLSTIQKTHHLGEMETASMSRVIDLMDVPLVALVPWTSEQSMTVIPKHLVMSHSHGFSVDTDFPIPIATDALIQWALQTDDILTLPVHYLTTETRRWLSGPNIGQVLAVALRTDPEHQSLGLLLVADVAERFWSNHQIEVLEVIGRQLAWSRRYLMLTEKLTAHQKQLEQLNWYKQRSLEYLCWTLGNDIKRLNTFTASPSASRTMNDTSSIGEASGRGMESIRAQQLLRHMAQLLIDIRPMVRDEQWQFHIIETTVPLVSLLKRAIARVDPLVQKRQLWVKVHNEQNVTIIGDISKTELVLHEVLKESCRRAPRQSGLDIWCRPIEGGLIELSITDQGYLDPQLLEELHQGRSTDWLAASILDVPPGLNFAICQALIQRLGGEFNVYALNDGRMLSQMTLRIDDRSSTARER